MPKPLRASPPDTASSVEVRAPRTQGRRRFSATEKQRIVGDADACAHGELGALHAITDRTHPEHGAMRDWHGGEFDSRDFDAEAANGRLRRIKL